MAFWYALIPVACCVAVPAVIAIVAFAGSSKRRKIQDDPERGEETLESLPGDTGRD